MRGLIRAEVGWRPAAIPRVEIGSSVFLSFHLLAGDSLLLETVLEPLGKGAPALVSEVGVGCSSG